MASSSQVDGPKTVSPDGAFQSPISRPENLAENEYESLGNTPANSMESSYEAAVDVISDLIKNTANSLSPSGSSDFDQKQSVADKDNSPELNYQQIMGTNPNERISCHDEEEDSPNKSRLLNFDIDGVFLSGKPKRSASGGSSIPGLDRDNEGVVSTLLDEPPDNVSPLGSQPTLSDFPESGCMRPTAQTATCKLEELKKVRIYVLANGVTTSVSWFTDTPPKEVQKAVLCACDCIQDGGVQLLELLTLKNDRELQEMLEKKENEIGGKLIRVSVDGIDKWYKRGATLDFEEFGDSLRNNQLYLLKSAAERNELIDVTGDRYRRILLQVPALSHLEAREAVKVLRKGANLVKKTRIEGRHFRYFQLSPDLRRLLWYSGKKASESTTLNLSEVLEIRIGEQIQGIGETTRPVEDNFYRLCSFSLITKTRELELCAKDEEEFDTWVAGLKALAAHFRDVKINKVQLLGHSRKFRQQIQQIEDKDGTAITPTPSIHTFLQSKIKTRADAVHQLEILDAMLTRLKTRILPIDYSTLRGASSCPPVETDNFIVQCFDDGAAANMNDKQLEYRQAQAFIIECERELTEIKRLLDQHCLSGLAKHEGLSPDENAAFLAKVAQKLWEVNINIENVSRRIMDSLFQIDDILVRLTTVGVQPNVVNTLSVIQRQLEEGKEKIAKTWSQFATSVVAPAMRKLKAFADDNDAVRPPPGDTNDSLKEPSSTVDHNDTVIEES